MHNTSIFLDTGLSWEFILWVLHGAKQAFIYINFTLAMILFVPYISLILLDILVYMGRLSYEHILIFAAAIFAAKEPVSLAKKKV
jgi:hypothetical protein